jgi:hypothetical protein
MENLAGLSKQNSFLLKKVPCHARIQILLLFSKKMLLKQFGQRSAHQTKHSQNFHQRQTRAKAFEHRISLQFIS